jgi:hypothetical protein
VPHEALLVSGLLSVDGWNTAMRRGSTWNDSLWSGENDTMDEDGVLGNCTIMLLYRQRCTDLEGVKNSTNWHASLPRKERDRLREMLGNMRHISRQNSVNVSEEIGQQTGKSHGLFRYTCSRSCDQCATFEESTMREREGGCVPFPEANTTVLGPAKRRYTIMLHRGSRTLFRAIYPQKWKRDRRWDAHKKCRRRNANAC